MFRGLAVRIDIRGGARHGDDVTGHKAVTLDMQARLVIHERIHVEIERRAVRVITACGMVRRNLVRRRVRCHLNGGAGRRDGGGELRRELHKVARLDGTRGRSQREIGHCLSHNLDGSTRVSGEQGARRERRHPVDAPVVEIQCVGKCLRIIELRSAVQRVSRLIPIGRNE